MAGGILIPGDYDDWTWAGTPVDPPGGIGPAVLTQIGTTGTYAYRFADNDTMVFPDQQIPHDYKEGTDIVPHIHFISDAAGTYTGTWTLTYSELIGAGSGITLNTPAAITASFNRAFGQFESETINFSAVMSGTGRTISSMATFTLTLTLSAGSGLFLFGLDGHYLKDRLGSKEITTK
jgi:hypothetical protein